MFFLLFSTERVLEGCQRPWNVRLCSPRNTGYKSGTQLFSNWQRRSVFEVSNTSTGNRHFVKVSVIPRTSLFLSFLFRIGWNLNVLPHLPSSVLKHVGLLQGKKIIEGRLQKSIISYFLRMLFYFTSTICLCKNCCLWPSFLGSRQIFERRRTCTVPPFVHTGLAEPSKFLNGKQYFNL